MVKEKRSEAQVANPVHLPARQVTIQPSAVPTYASACSGAVRYSSACSCWGVPKSTVTAAAPLTTTTVAITETASVTTTATVTATTTLPADCTVQYDDGYTVADERAGLTLRSAAGPAANDQECCAICYNTPGCGLFYTSGTSTCNLLVTDSGNGDIGGGKSNVCPNGEYLHFSNITGLGTGFGYGPCFNYAGRP
ncbi:hypothetical protein H2201_004364 [Coniosporium apollinis]|uniref:Apple domain-containing protein n=2 Tax=Coniosporium TaxID=2810619 RepID=A0ABQ9NZD4_9PEZI|nr:hypothetical protein H2199_004044 [Cladosporium sp. JES 115]KAJ9665482.1 hypothetical protein H2201_004364 [Coniosporium apollinis]